MRKDLKGRHILQGWLLVLLPLLLCACGREGTGEAGRTVYRKEAYLLPGASGQGPAALGNANAYYAAEEDGKTLIRSYRRETGEDETLPIDVPKGEQVLGMTEYGDGGLVLLTHTETEGQGRFYLTRYGTDGRQPFRTDITDAMQDRDAKTQLLLETDGEGRLCLLDGFFHVCVWDGEGRFLSSLRNDAMMQGLACTEGGVWVRESRQGKVCIRQLLTEAGKWGKGRDKGLPQSGSPCSVAMAAGKEGSLLLMTGTGLWSYDLEAGEAAEELDWAEHGMAAEDILAWRLQGEAVACITAEGAGTYLTVLSPVEEGEAMETAAAARQIVTINEEGTYGPIRQAVKEFNSRNEKYMVRIVENPEGGNLDDGIRKRDVEILAGRGTDLICMPRAWEYRKYADKGLLEDLYPYLDGDEETGREDYLENICRAYERNGKLYGMTPAFLIDTLMVPTKYASGMEDGAVSIRDFIDMVGGRSADMKTCVLFTNKTMVFRMLLRPTYEQFIDFTDYTCDFESEDFITWITFLNSLEVYPDIKMEEEEEKDYLLAPRYCFDVHAYQTEKIHAGGEEVTFLGYPCRRGCGSFLYNDTIVGIYSQSGQKEGAWEFLKFLLGEEQQDLLQECSEHTRFPVRISSLEKSLARARKPEYGTDEDGNRIEMPKGEVSLLNGEKIPYYAATEEETGKMWELLTTVTEIRDGLNDELDAIIMEEIGAFYEGDKSAEETAAVIQNRVQLFLKEQQ